MNGINIEVYGAESTYSFDSPVVPPIGSTIYIRGYYYTVVSVEYAITGSRELTNAFSAVINVSKNA